MREMVGGCCVCSDDRGWSENPLVYCDGQSCSVAVHQACYGIVTVPTGPWYCRKCESQERSVKVKCELCPSKYGALKKTDNAGWAHVVCALYIPEVRFGNVTTMEPIQLQLIPAERFNKVCYICEEKGKASSAGVGACMQCNKVGCKQQFHVTCAQSLGLLCEEAGNYLDNVKYCGYCSHHYSKLKKGGNVKTIPPYKPVNYSHNSDSNSEKESEIGGPSNPKGNTPPTGRRKAAAGNKNASMKTPTAPVKTSSGSQQKPVLNTIKPPLDKSKVTNSKSAKTDDSAGTDNLTADKIDKNDKKDVKSESQDSAGHTKEVKEKDNKNAKKRKVNSRTPTPVGVVQSEVSVVVSSAAAAAPVSSATTSSATSTVTDKKNVAIIGENSVDKSKKQKVDTTQSIISNQPVVALTSISTIKLSSPAVTVSEPVITSEVSSQSAQPTSSIIHTAQAQQPPQQQQHHHQQQFGSLVVSVPLASTSLSPHNPIITNHPTSVLAVTPILPERRNSLGSAGSSTPLGNSEPNLIMTGGNSNQGVLTSEMSGGGLKITYEKQPDRPDPMNTEVDMELEPSTPAQEVPAKRGRSLSTEKSDRTTRNKKRHSGPNGVPTQPPPSSTIPKRASRSQHTTPPPQEQPGAFAVISQAQIKDSPPSSPSSESQSAPPSSRGRTKGRKSAPEAVECSSSSGFPKDTKDIKIFQNGITTAPHMLGNQLNPNSNMHQKMTDHLSSELEAHSIYNPLESNSNLVGPQMHHRVVQSARASSTGSSTASGGSGLSSMLGGGGGTIPQTLDQLLERQWEQGSQFLMEQAQHFDIASLLSCLHQLRAENLRLEEHVGSLLQRRDHLLAVNARLAIPLTGQPAAPQPPHPHTVNNIHPNLTASHGDVPRPSRHGSSSSYDRNSQSSQHGPMENGLPPDTYPQNSHRSPAGGQPSPTVRHSTAGSYSNNSLHRQGADSSGRSAPRPQHYPLYERPGSSTQQQMVMRRDRDPDLHHLSSKPS